MFCPVCGSADQQPESYCRSCGTFLPDISKKRPRETPEKHAMATVVLSGMSVAACFTLAILLYTILGFRPETHPLIYVTAGLLIAMGAWHVQIFWRGILLRKHFKKRPTADDAKTGSLEGSVATGKLLDPADASDAVPNGVIENTTRKLNVRR
jgi:hypothetical protein